MPVDFRAILTTFAALVSGAVAAFALTNPPLQDWAIEASPSEIDRWISSGPTATAAGAVVAVGACALSQQRGSRRAAWIAVAVAVALIALIRVVVPEVASLDLLILLLIVKTIAAGCILGCAVAASWDKASARNATLVGVTTTFLTAQAFASGTGRMSTSAVGEPAWWLLIATVAAAIGCAVLAQAGFRIRRPDAGEIRIALVVVIALAIGHRVLGSVIDRQEFASETTAWVVMVLCAGAALALTSIAAHRLGDQSGAGGKFLWAATALAAASAPTLHTLTGLAGQWASLKSPWTAVLVAGLAVAVGLRLNKRIPVTAAVIVLAAVPLSELLPFTSAHGTVSIVVKIAALGFGGASLLGALAPASLVDATLGLAIPFSAMTFTSIAVLTDRFSYITFLSSSYVQHQVETTRGDGELFGVAVALPVDYVTAAAIGTALLFVTIVAICGVALGRTSRIPESTAGPESPEPGVSDTN